jgi:hypothetical protein
VTTPEVVEPPSFVRFAVPPDSSEHVSGEHDISITFRRPIPDETARLDLFPAPVSHRGQVFSATGRTLSWLDVRFDPDELAYRLLIDGPSIPQPEIIEYFPTDRPGITGRMGGCLYLEREGPDLSEAVVFAVPIRGADVSYEVLPRFFEEQHASAATLVRYVHDFCDNFYFFTYMKTEAFMVIAVLDTTGDGIYDLRHDWWGVRGPVGPSDALFDVPFHYDITIRPPLY